MGAALECCESACLNSVEDSTLFSSSFNGLVVRAKVLEVYDGDTITLLFRFRSQFNRFKIRLSGVNCPELRKCTEEEKQRGLEARDKLRALIMEKHVHLTCHGMRTSP